MLNNGIVKYYVAWEGTTTKTWEPVTSLYKTLVREYHLKDAAISKEAAATLAARVAAGEEAHRAQGFRVMGRRSRQRQDRTSAAEKQKLVEERVAEYMAERISYFIAYDRAEEDYINGKLN